MSSTESLVESRREQDHSSIDRRVNRGNDRQNPTSQKAEQVDMLTVFKLISAILVVLIGIAGYWIAALF